MLSTKQDKYIAIIDCNNFYASCERVFNPKLNKKPVIAITAWERRYRNLFTEGMFTKTIQTIKEVLPAVEQMNS